MTKNGDRLRMIARGLRGLVDSRNHPMWLDLTTYAAQLEDMADQMDVFRDELVKIGAVPPPPSAIERQFNAHVQTAAANAAGAS